MNFDPLEQRYPSRRKVVFGRCAVAASQPLAAQAGLDVLKEGGNAVDAAIAAASVLTVAEPTSNGLGSDAFALIWSGKRLYGLNGSGRSPASISAQALSGQKEVPRFGWTPVTVPGAAGAWAELWRRFGRLPFPRLLQPAVDAAAMAWWCSPPLPAAGARLWSCTAGSFTGRSLKSGSGCLPPAAPRPGRGRSGTRRSTPAHWRSWPGRSASPCTGETWRSGSTGQPEGRRLFAQGGPIRLPPGVGGAYPHGLQGL